MKKLLLFLLAACCMQGIFAMDVHNQEILEVPVRDLDPADVRTRDLHFLQEYTQMPIGQSVDDRYQAMVHIIVGGNASKEKITCWRKAHSDFLEHIQTHYSDDVAFAPLIKVLDGQLRLLALDEQLIDNPLDTQIWDQAEALCDELVAQNSACKSAKSGFITLKKAVHAARPRILANRIVSEDSRNAPAVRTLENERLLLALLSQDPSMRLCPNQNCSHPFAIVVPGILERLYARIFGGYEILCPACNQIYSINAAIDYFEAPNADDCAN
jgi:hypothetical protein